VKVGTMIEPRLPGAAEFAAAAERIGVDSLWVPEVWGYDALTGLAYLAAKTSTIKLGTFVVQLGSRSPALLASRVAALWQDGRRDEARQAVPMDLGRLTNLVGTEDGIAERVRKYRAAGITTLLAKLEGDYPYQLTTLERLLEIVTDSGCASAGAARGAI
jgi:alkanesulfonate monooxygenase SsuD/methylene tetrahydromethanopterin reductase-like flavin-dependent oxidoreductase (luciferase family)